MKQMLLANKVPTLPFEVFQSTQVVKKRKLEYPLIVKPIAQGSSAGISNASIVNSDDELKKQVNFIIKTFSAAAFVEPFLRYREFSVSMLGNPPVILPIIEPDFSLLPKKFLPIDSLEVKWIFEKEADEIHLTCPAKIEDNLKARIEDIALRTWEVLDIYDFCRIDMRTDEQNNVFVLDVNAPPGLIPPEVSDPSYFPIAANVAGINYEEMLKMIMDSAVKRYKI